MAIRRQIEPDGAPAEDGSYGLEWEWEPDSDGPFQKVWVDFEPKPDRTARVYIVLKDGARIETVVSLGATKSEGKW